MTGLALLLFGAAAAHLLAQALRVPAIPLLLLAGVALSSTGLLVEATLEDALILGVAFLLFATGTELDPGRAATQRGAIIRVAVLQVVLLTMLGAGAAAALGFGAIESAYIALALTASSTLVGVGLLRSRKQLFEPFGRLVLGVLLLQDLFVILLIPLVTGGAGGAGGIARDVAAIGLLLALAWALRRWLTPALARLDGDMESLLLSALTVLFGFVALAAALRLPVVAGAFLAGVALARFPFRSMMRSRIAPVIDFFSALFFTALGALIRVPTAGELVPALLFSALVVLATPPLVAWITERTGAFSARPALEAGLLLAQTSELSLVIGLHGRLAGDISESAFTIIALATVITMTLTPFLTSDRVVWALLRVHPLRVESESPIPESGHILVLGSGITGMPLVETLLAAGNAVVVVDDDPAVIARLRAGDIPCIRGDASDLEVLHKANARTARLITSTIRRPADNQRLLEHVQGVPVLVRVFDEEDARRIRSLGGTPVLYSEAAAEGLLRWLDAAGPAARA
jgi:CPA2 family monovalent cation:H+ antiporter-2